VSYAVSTTTASRTSQLLDLSVLNLPAGVAGTFDTPRISAGQGAVLTLDASSTATLTSATFTVKASGCTEQSQTASVTVTGSTGSGGCGTGRILCWCDLCGSSQTMCNKICGP